MSCRAVLPIYASIIFIQVFSLQERGVINWIVVVLVIVRESSWSILVVLVLRVVMRPQMTQSLMQLIHKHMIVSYSKVCMRVTTELVVSKDHLSDASHHPLSLIHWAHAISITIEHGDWCLLDVSKWNIRSDSIVFAYSVIVGVLLEPILNSILEEVSQSLGGEWLLGPDCLLLAPHFTEMSTDLWFVLFPVLTLHRC